MNRKVWAKMPMILLAGLMMSTTLPVRGEDQKQDGLREAESKKEKRADLKTLCCLAVAASFCVSGAGICGYGLCQLLKKADSFERD